ncbi:MAG TPA: TIGR00730 family Rossman fold protein, partial [Gammaproteobacteria bacterium]|nr:TIGR00730 family Rossman fold protein [Gammaproteobacteria bacterium]
FWADMLAWFKKKLVGEGMISEDDLKLYSLANNPEEVVKTLQEFYKDRSFEPSPREREIMSDL